MNTSADSVVGGAVELRRATSRDVEACLAVQRAAAVMGYAHIFAQDLYPFPDDTVRAEWTARLASDAQVVVATLAGDVIGTISARPPYVEALFVVPEHWGSGVAVRLHDRALELIAAAGDAVAQLDVMVDNTRARRFYERHGWLLGDRSSVSPFPPHPKLVGYHLEI